MSEVQLKDYLMKAYKDGLSINQIAKVLGTYVNFVRRKLIFYGIKLRDKSEAMKLKVERNEWDNPTPLGSHLTEITKNRISAAVESAWDSKTPAEMGEFKRQAKERWDNSPEEDKRKLIELGASYIREAAFRGSKLELFLGDNLNRLGYKCIQHKENLIANDLMQLDLFLPEDRVCIEIDGKSHWEPIWGEERLEKQQRADSEKNGHLIAAGYVVIRFKYVDDKTTRAYFNKVLRILTQEIDSIRIKFPEEHQRIFFIKPEDYA